ncbi:YitT family protein [Spiroplasma sp. DGKH1]|uniref:YitT family protein n=1 Tax=Spiroplasma sp. DGKH1 TaxID=3050074 RepID=UPI0034C6838D
MKETKKQKLADEELYENIKKNIRQTERMMKEYINETTEYKNQLEQKLLKLSKNPDQSKEFKLKLQLEQFDYKEKQIINKFVNKIVAYEKQLVELENKLGVKEKISALRSEYNEEQIKKDELSLEAKNYLKKTQNKGYIYLVLAGLICTIAFDYFLTPSKVLPPGLGAVGKIFAQYIFPPLNDSNINNANLMYYVFYIVNNIPLIIFSWIMVGRRFTINTLIFMVCQTAFHIIINGIGDYHGIPVINSTDFHFLQNLNDIDKSSVRDLWIFFFGLIGAILNGIGYGFLYIGDACPGGTDFVNNYISRTKKKPVGNVSILVNTLVMLITWAMSYAVKTPTPNPDFITFYFSAPFFAAFMVIIVCGIVSNKIFPKYRNTTLMVITSNPQVIIDRLRENGYRNNTIWKVSKNLNNEFSDNNYIVMITISLISFKRVRETILLADPDAIIRAQTTYKTYQMPHKIKD